MNDLNFWHSKWNTASPRWDLKGPHPLMPRVLKLIKMHVYFHKNELAFVPGCGRAHDAAFLANSGFKVTASDFVIEAINYAKDLYGSLPRLNLKVEDILKTKMNEIDFYDVIFDRAMCNALPQESRLNYIKNCTKKLKSGGLFISILFTKINKNHTPPPFELSFLETKKLLQNNFNLLHREERNDGACDTIILAEAIEIWKKN